MAFLQPPITGDPQLDSWTLRLTQQINQGLVPGAAAQGGGGGGGAQGNPGVDGTNGNSALYLYQRTVANTAPDRPTTVTFDFSTDPVADADGGWTSDLPETGGEYLWVTFRYVAVQSGTITGIDSWDTPVLLGVPGEDGADGDSSITANILSNEGNIFRNAVGPDKELSAFVFDNGTGEELTNPESPATPFIFYTWRRANNAIVRVTSQTDRTVISSGGVEANGSGFPDIVVDAGDVDTQETFTLEVEVREV